MLFIQMFLLSALHKQILIYFVKERLNQTDKGQTGGSMLISEFINKYQFYGNYFGCYIKKCSFMFEDISFIVMVE